MNPLSKILLDFIFKFSSKTIDEFSEEKLSAGMDFESFVDVMSVFHKNTALEIKFRCKININN